MHPDNPNLENEYKARINRTFDYIEQNLEKQLSLEELSAVANFSKFHFHRIFKAMVGETPSRLILRLRLERAATLLETHPHQSITDIAVACGFTDLSVFSRNFKNFFGRSASDFREELQAKSNFRQTQRKAEQSAPDPSRYLCFQSKTIQWKTDMELNKSIDIQELPAVTVAYVRHVGPYQGDAALFEKLWHQLFTWAGPRGLVGGTDFTSMIVYHDNPNITEEDKLRTSVCITVPPDTPVSGEVGKMDLEGGKYVVARFELKPDEYKEAWDWLYGQWMPQSGYQPDDKPYFERYPEAPKGERFAVDICIPVKPL